MRALRATCGALLSLSACSAGASNDPALAALLRVNGAQFVAGSMPVGTSGPAVAAIELETNTIWPGYANKPIAGALAESATAVALGLAGDRGYWTLSAGPPDFSAPTLPTFHATAAFSPAIVSGSYALMVRAVDAQARFGPASSVVLTALPDPPSISAPTGSLVITLRWDVEADLDLHVVDPLGDEIYHGATTTLDAFSPGAGATTDYGYLDIDSNADCRIDGRRAENVVWVGTPPAGAYVVRVDVPSLCGESIARFDVTASLDGAALAAASGTLLDSDTWGAHDRGAGLSVLSFVLP